MRRVVALASAVGVATMALVVVLSGGSPAPAPSGELAAFDARAATAAAPARTAREDCSTRSEARFPGAFTDKRNLVVGPLVLMGGTSTDARTVREFGGNKFPLLVEAGHTVKVQVAPGGRRLAGLAYGPLPEGEVRLRDAYRSVTFVACRRGARSGSSADGTPVTFWSGFVLTRRPACIPLDISVDGEPSPRRVGLSLGRRCRS